MKIRQNTKTQQNIIFTTQTRHNKCKLRGLESNNSRLISKGKAYNATLSDESEEEEAPEQEKFLAEGRTQGGL
jgi:hypothetical protein